MKTISKVPILLFTIFLIVQCHPEKKTSSNQVDILSYNWGTSQKIIIENGYYHSYKELDTLTHKLVGDTLLPVIQVGTTIMLNKFEPVKMELKNFTGDDEYVITEIGIKTDTFTYDIRNYLNKSFLVLLSKNSAMRILELKNGGENIEETDNNNIPKIDVEGYSIGDNINREDFDVVYSDQFGNILTEEVILKNNQNVLMKIQGGNYVEEIKWINISNSEIDNIIKKINKEFSTDPVVEPEKSSSDQKELASSYYWSENEVTILIQRTGLGTGDWTLTYNNLVVSGILSSYNKSNHLNL